MARELMPKSGIMMPYVVVTRDAAVVGVSTVDGVAGAINLENKYLKISDASATYMTKAEGATKDYVGAVVQPLMTGALFKQDPFVNNNIPFRSGGGNGVDSVDLIKVDTNNAIAIGNLAADVQGVNIYSNGRLRVIDKNQAGVETSYPLYSQRYRPEIGELPFAAIGEYVKDAKGRTIGVNRTGINADIKRMTQKVTMDLSPTIPDASQPYDAVNLRQLQAAGGGSGASLNGVMNNFIGAVEWFNGSRAKLPSGYIAADGQLVLRSQYPDLTAAVLAGILSSVSDSSWITNPSAGSDTQKTGSRGMYSSGNGSTTLRIPDLNGVRTQGDMLDGVAFSGLSTPKGVFLRGDGGGSTIGIYGSGAINMSSAPNITGHIRSGSSGSYSAVFLDETSGAFTPSGADGVQIQGVAGTLPGRFNTVDLNASKSNDVYGRDNNSTEIRPNSATGIWIIRASGAFTASNTKFDVIDSSASEPASGTNPTLRGGLLESVHKIAGVDRVIGSIQSEYVWGNPNVSLKFNTGLYSAAGDYVRGNTMTYSAGDLSVPGGTVSSKRHYVLNPIGVSFDGYWGSSNIPFQAETSAVQGEGYLYPLLSQKVYWPGHYGATWNFGTWCKADGPYFGLTWTAENGQNKSWFFEPNSGNATAPGSWVNGSDERHKSNIEIVGNALEAVCSWRGVTYDKKDGGREVGLISQDVEKDCPEAIIEQERTFNDGEVVEDFKYLNTAGVSAAYHTEAIKELSTMVKILQEEVKTLKEALASK